MTKCKVISYNKYREVMVFEYENKEIQISYHLDSVPSYIYVRKIKDRYEISLTDVSSSKPRKTKKAVNTEVEFTDEVKTEENIIVV